MTVNDTEAKEVLELEADPVAAVDAAAGGTATRESSEEDTQVADEVGSKRDGRSVSVSVRGLVVAAAILTLAVAMGVLGWLYMDARTQLSAQATRSGNDTRAEKIALDYAVNAATMDFKDLPGWRVRLVAGTSPELNKKLSEAGTSMEQVLVPLEWSSSAEPLVAKVRSVNGGVYIVDSFVSVQTKTVQAPEALQSTATYSTTIDSNNNWQITDVGGIDSAMGPR